MSKIEKSPQLETGQLDLLRDIAAAPAVREAQSGRPTSIVLVDLENIQPNNLDVLAGLPFKVYMFAGENQSKVSIEIASAMQAMGNNATYVRMSGNGPNALDFHIAFYIGELAATEAVESFYIVSKDRGFDPLIKHLARRLERPLAIERVETFEKILTLRGFVSSDLEERIANILSNLHIRGTSKPRKVKTLANTIDCLFAKQLKEQELAQILEVLQERGFVSVNGANVSYALPPCNGKVG